MKNKLESVIWFGKILAGCAIFALGFDVFLAHHDMNAGGISGLAMVLVHILGFGSVGTATMLMNLPLFLFGGMKIGKKFFIGSLAGMIGSSLFLDLFAMIPAWEVEPLIAALYGGLVCGLGLGIVFAAGASTGGSDIIVRLLKLRWQHVPIGMINTCFDAVVVTLTGIVFGDISKALYSGVTVFVMGQVIDAVVYRFDYSKVVMIVSKDYAVIAKRIGSELDRGATFLEGEGVYSGNATKVVYTVVKKQQVSELKRLVVEVDPKAFIVVQEAHQVLGEGFGRYSKDSL